MKEDDHQYPDEFVVSFGGLPGNAVDKSPNPEHKGRQCEGNCKEEEKAKDLEHRGSFNTHFRRAVAQLRARRSPPHHDVARQSELLGTLAVTAMTRTKPADLSHVSAVLHGAPLTAPVSAAVLE